MSLKIQKLTTTSGFLECAPIEFSSGLTCIIGARGTCKSTIVETIRFVFNFNKERVDQMLRDDEGDPNGFAHRGLIKATLAGGTARCDIEQAQADGDKIRFSVERELESSNSRIYRDGIKAIDEKDILDCIEIYSQGELQDIAESNKRRLQLIDRPNKPLVAKLIERRREASVQLAKLGNEIRNRKAAIEARLADIKSLEAYREQLKQMQASRPQLSQELDAERNSFNERVRLVEKIEEAINHRESLSLKLDDFIVWESLFTERKRELEKINDPIALELASMFSEFAEFIQFLAIKRSHEQSAVPKQINLLTSLKHKFEEQSQNYYRLRKSQQEINESLRKEDTLQKQLSHLEKVAKEVEEWNHQLQHLKEERGRLRAEISLMCDDLFRMRSSQVEEINQLFSQKVLLTISPGTRSTEYRDALFSLLEGSRIRSQEEISSEISERILPSDLIDIVEKSDSTRLSRILNRDLGQITRLIGFLADSPKLYDLEAQVFEDNLEITFFDGLSPKKVDKLSKGQKATAMLPLILRPACYPLIFDQPEDDLDNRFIYDTFVDQIRQLKQQRQLIFVTHNANIPVLGDAETVVVMRMETPTKAMKPQSGTVEQMKESILSILEGGALAFKSRQQRYGHLLT